MKTMQINYVGQQGDCGHDSALITQLNREISCLQRQLDRLKMLDGYLDHCTLNTYQEMISSRREILQDVRGQ